MIGGLFGKKGKKEKKVEAKSTETQKKKPKKKPVNVRSVAKAVPKGAERTVVGQSGAAGANAMDLLRAKQSGQAPKAKAKPSSESTVKARKKGPARKKTADADSTSRTTIHSGTDSGLSAMELLRQKKK